MAAAGYTSREAAALLGLAEARLRALVRSAGLAPERAGDGRYRFSLEDLVLLRAARDLGGAGVTGARRRGILGSLRRQLPAGRALAGVRVAVEGGGIRVRVGEDSWDAESGQRLLDFEVAELARRAAPFSRERAARAHAQPARWTPDGWFALACELETGEPAEAVAAYRRVLGVSPRHAGAHLNLGRLLHERGELAAAEIHYREALAAAPGDATAAFNLGVVLEDLGRLAAAAEAYREALAAAPNSADSHYNLAGVLERLGEEAAALRHLKAYRSLVRRC